MPSIGKHLLVISALFFIPETVHGQSPRFYHLTNTDGLSQNIVYDVSQDRDGFIWLATEYGLNRYDGKVFLTWVHQPGNTSSLPENRVHCITEDQEGNLWVGTNGGGIGKLNKTRGKFTNFMDSAFPDQIYVNNCIWNIVEDRASGLWLGTFGGGLKRFDMHTGTFTSWNKQNGSLPSDDIRCVLPESDGSLWLGSFGEGLCHFDPVSGHMIRYVNKKDDSHSLPANEIICLWQDDDPNYLWIGTYGAGVCRLDKHSGHVTRYTPTDELYGEHQLYVRSIVSDPFDKRFLWIGSWKGGLQRLDKFSGTFTSYVNDPLDPVSLPDNKILCLFADRSGLLWTGTYGAGVSRFTPAPKKIATLSTVARGNGLSAPIVYSVYPEDRDHVWIGTLGGGLNYWNRSTDIVTVYKNDSTDKSSLSNNTVYCLLPESNGSLWVGTAGGGLNRMDTKTGKCKVYRHSDKDEHSLSSDLILCAYRDAQDVLWFGTYGQGLNKWNPQTENFTRYVPDEKDKSSLSHGSIFSLFEDSKGNFWVGTGSGGLNLFDRQTGKTVRYQYEENNPRSISNNFITSITEDNLGRLWVGTMGGLNLLEWKNGTPSFIRYHMHDGLPSDLIAGILADQKGNLWVSTGKGICRMRLNPDGQPEIKIYDQYAGLQDLEFSPKAAAESNDGTFFFGGIKGLNAFHPDSISDNPFAPPIVLTRLQIFNKEVLVDEQLNSKSGPQEKEGRYYIPRSITHLGELVLSYREEVFSIDYAGLSYLNPEKNSYAYKMEGFDKEWNYVGAQRSATYTHLEPGEYRFLVKAANADGVWNETPAELKVIITPPWWTTWTFRITAGGLLLVTVVVFVRQRINRLENEKKKLESKVAERTLEIASQKKQIEGKAEELSIANEQLQKMDRFKNELTNMLVHDLKNPLGSIIQGVESGSLDENKSQVAASARTMFNLVMNVLQVQNLENAKVELNLQSVSLFRLVHTATIQVSIPARQKNISILNHIGEHHYAKCDETLLERVLINLLANAVMYSSNNGTVIVRAEEVNDSVLKVIVEDNGKGLDLSQIETLFNYDAGNARKHNRYSTGIGLKYCKLVIDAHAQKISGTTEENGGAVFSFTLEKAVAGQQTETVVEQGSVSEQRLILEEHEKHIIRSHADGIQQLQVFESSRLMRMLTQIQPETRNIGRWKEEVRLAVYSCNERKYHDLVQLINPR